MLIALAGYFNRFLLLDEEYGGSASDLEPVWGIARFSDPRSLFRNFYLSNEPRILIEGERGESAEIRLRYKQRKMILNINDREIVWYQESLSTLAAARAVLPVIEELRSEGAEIVEARLYGYDRYALSHFSCAGSRYCGFHVFAKGSKSVPYPKTLLSEMGWNIVYHTRGARDVIVRINRALNDERMIRLR